MGGLSGVGGAGGNALIPPITSAVAKAVTLSTSAPALIFSPISKARPAIAAASSAVRQPTEQMRSWTPGANATSGVDRAIR